MLLTTWSSYALPAFLGSCDLLGSWQLLFCSVTEYLTILSDFPSRVKDKEYSGFSKKSVQQIKTTIQQMLQNIYASVHCQCYTARQRAGYSNHCFSLAFGGNVKPSVLQVFLLCAPPAAHLRLQSSLLTWLKNILYTLGRDLKSILIFAIDNLERLPDIMANSLFFHEKNP